MGGWLALILFCLHWLALWHGYIVEVVHVQPLADVLVRSLDILRPGLCGGLGNLEGFAHTPPLEMAEAKKGSYVAIHSSGFRDFLLKPELLRMRSVERHRAHRARRELHLASDRRRRRQVSRRRCLACSRQGARLLI